MQVATTALAAACTLGSSLAADFPRRRSGLWEVHSASAQALGLPPTLQCIGDRSDSAKWHLDRAVGKRGSCTLGAFRRMGNAWVADSICREGRTVVSSRKIATGDFLTYYRIDTIVRYEPPLGGSRDEDKEALEARYIGRCAPGQRPGDVVVPGMGTLNMTDGTFRGERRDSAAARR